MKCCSCSSEEELPEGTMVCSECHFKAIEPITAEIFSESVLKWLTSDKAPDLGPRTYYYYPKQTEFFKKWFGVKLETDDCIEKGVRFIKIPVIIRNSPFLMRKDLELLENMRQDEEYKIHVMGDWGKGEE